MNRFVPGEDDGVGAAVIPKLPETVSSLRLSVAMRKTFSASPASAVIAAFSAVPRSR